MNAHSHRTVPSVLAPLVDYLDSLTGRADLNELSARLVQSQVTVDDVRDFARFEPDGYCRNLVAHGPWYHLLVLCWRSGQRSPIHDHAESTCAFKVLTGVCSETVFEVAASGQVFPVNTVHHAAGSIVATQDADTHQVSNLQVSGVDLVTLHIYTPPLGRMRKHSITGEAATPWLEAESP